MSATIHWGVPGTTRPTECNIFDLMDKEARGKPTTSSEVIISYHYLDEPLAVDIATRALDARQAELFNRLRAIDPMQFQPPAKWWQFWKLFAKPRTVTWRDYAHHLGYDDDSFWVAYEGISGKVKTCLKARV